MSDADSFLYLFSRLQSELNRLFGRFMEEGEGTLQPEGWSPNVDVIESPQAVELLVEVPGLEPEALKVEVAANLVTITGRKVTGERRTDGARFEQVECPQGAFRRHIELDRTVNSVRGEAWLEDGILHVRFPRIEDKRSRSHLLAVSSGRPGGHSG